MRAAQKLLRLMAVCGLVSVSLSAAHADTTTGQISNEIEQGRRIYVEGILPSGKPLQGIRQGSAVSGAMAACITCHRRSGMGGVEGDLQVPPISGRFLYAVRADMALAIMDPRFGRMMNQAHRPYDDESLANAIRNGVSSDGRELKVLMPHFTLSDAEVKSLTAYLKQLSGQWSPGVTPDTIRFATVITPGVEPERRQILLNMLRSVIAQKNGSTVTGQKRGGRRHMVTGAEQILGTERKWELDVWELQGAPETWTAQLEQKYNQQPVFALLSGLANGTWAPVHEFCERKGVPSWFPSVDMVPDAGLKSAVYPLYFTRGVALEADVLAKHLVAAKSRPARLIQVYRDEVGRSAANELRRALNGSGIVVEDRVLTANDDGAVKDVVAKTIADDAVMFWLRPGDIALLANNAVTLATPYFSAEMGNAEFGPLPGAWRSKARLVYPYELPGPRESNLAYFRTWLNFRKLPLVDEVLQSQIYFAVTFMSDTVAEMLDNVQRDYLLERAEDMMDKREIGKAEGEARDRGSLGTPEERDRRYPMGRKLDESAGLSLEPGQGPNLMTMRRGTTVYPRLTLGPGQRYASRGAYIVRFDGDMLVAESDWIVP